MHTSSTGFGAELGGELVVPPGPFVAQVTDRAAAIVKARSAGYGDEARRK
jgi:hypothetical protein